jgi:hypothetical protein
MQLTPAQLSALTTINNQFGIEIRRGNDTRVLPKKKILTLNISTKNSLESRYLIEPVTEGSSKYCITKRGRKALLGLI